MNATPSEVWKPIAETGGHYEVSNLGRVRSLDRIVETARGRRHLPGKILRPSTARTPNYPVVYVGNARGTVRVHNLVLEAFVGPRPPGYVACHGNGDPTDNRAENLRWDTYSANNYDLVDHGTHFNASKTHCPHGHEYTPENTRRRPAGMNGRTCAECQRAANRRCKARRRNQLVDSI